MRPILVVDDDPDMRGALQEAIRKLGYETVLAENGHDALSKVGPASFSLVITDMKMPKMDGLSFLKEIRRRAGNLPVLIITGYGTIENAVEAMKEGAMEYLMKPFSFETLGMKIDAIMERLAADREMVTESPKIQRVLQLAASVASGDTSVLISGESGTGKELLARFIHRLSHRRDKPFVAVNCAAIPDNLMESELFGFEKGAFTGALERKIGKFELAAGGTILLDEIGEMSMGLQAKLLRVLQEREIDRVGGRQPVPVDIRVIATTNRDLYRESSEGRFREDLYYRLSVFPITIPPLRERPEDVSVLALHFLKRFSAAHGKPVSAFSDEAMSMLMRRQWRGNIRELENAVQRAVVLSSGGVISYHDFLYDEEPPAQDSLPMGIREMERDLILRTLKDTNGNKTRAAKVLGVSVRTIRNKLNEYGKSFPT